jgi:hypothetical protein
VSEGGAQGRREVFSKHTGGGLVARNLSKGYGPRRLVAGVVGKDKIIFVSIVSLSYSLLIHQDNYLSREDARSICF